jgi:hypothetical protein
MVLCCFPPQGRCWIEGDNRSHSTDSRNMYGPVHLGLLEGRAVCVVWPPHRLGWVKSEKTKGRILSEAGALSGSTAAR